jgi:hypothetical protein
MPTQFLVDGLGASDICLADLLVGAIEFVSEHRAVEVNLYMAGGTDGTKAGQAELFG